MKFFSSVCLSLMVVQSGCTWALKHPDMRVACDVTASDLEARFALNAAGAHFADPGPTQGRFPTGIAVVRLTKSWDEHHTAERLKIFPFRPYEAPFWSELFDGTPEVRSVFAIHEKSVRDDHTTVQELLRAAEVANAGLLLVYGYDNTSTPLTCTVSGVLFEIPSNTQLAVLRHQATRADAEAAAIHLRAGQPPQTPEDWDFYIDHVAFRGFERLFKTCVWQLIDRDKQADQLEPNPYSNPKPAYPRWWGR